MLANQPKQPTMAEILHDELGNITEPVLVNDLIDRVMQRFQSRAKNPRASVRTTITNESGSALVYVDRDHILPTRTALQDVRFRIPLSRLEIDEGGFAMDYLHYYLPSPGKTPLENQIKMLDAQGRALPARKIVHIQRRKDPFFGDYTDIVALLDIKDWLNAHHAKAGDHLIITVEDREAFTIRLAFEKASAVREDELALRDKQLCDLLYDMLEHSNDERIYLHQAIPTVLARLPDKAGYAGSHWRVALQQDERMFCEGVSITYSDGTLSIFERVEGDYGSEGKVFARKQGEQVYRFSARLKRGKGKPALVEIQGNQTMFDLDQILRQAFGHDTWDHLGGFWLLIPRASGRFREVEIGACAPDRKYKLDGSAVNVAVASLGLSIGSRLKYVYDFGDWIEHELTLEAIEPAQSKTHYPRSLNG